MAGRLAGTLRARWRGDTTRAGTATAHAPPDTPAAEDPGDFARDSRRPENIASHAHALNRVLVAVSLTLGAAVLALAGAIFFILPLVRYEPILLHMRGAELQLAEAQPLRIGTTTAELMLEAFLRRYIRERHQVIPNRALLESRWFHPEAFLVHTSTQPVMDTILDESRAIYDDVVDRPFYRDIVFLAVTKLQPTRHGVLWRVEFETHDHAGALTRDRATRRIWVANAELVQAVYAEEPTRETLVKNPLGILVAGYSVHEVRDPARPGTRPRAGG